MKILIEEHTEICKEGGLVHYQVKYKWGWWSPWQYVKRNYSHADPDIKKFISKEDAVEAARVLRENHEGPKVTIRDLSEHGNPIIKHPGI